MDEQIGRLAERVLAARDRGAAVMLTYGAHLVKNGAGAFLNRLMQAGLVTHLATQGAGVIHDWEFAFQGESGESVRDNAQAGTFGTWDETGRWINLAVLVGAADGLGFGEAVGKLIAEDALAMPSPAELRQSISDDPSHPLTAAKADLLWAIETFQLPSGRLHVEHPFKEYSVLACAYRLRVPLTIHPGIGYDIIVNHPLYHGGAIGRTATTDVRTFAASVERLDGGVYISVGSAIMSCRSSRRLSVRSTTFGWPKAAVSSRTTTWQSSIFRTAAVGTGLPVSRPAIIRHTIFVSARVFIAWGARWTTSAATIAYFSHISCEGWDSLRLLRASPTNRLVKGRTIMEPDAKLQYLARLSSILTSNNLTLCRSWRRWVAWHILPATSPERPRFSTE